MKKILALVCMLALALTFSMGSIGCGDKGTGTGTKAGGTSTKAETKMETKAETKPEAPK